MLNNNPGDISFEFQPILLSYSFEQRYTVDDYLNGNYSNNMGMYC